MGAMSFPPEFRHIGGSSPTEYLPTYQSTKSMGISDSSIVPQVRVLWSAKSKVSVGPCLRQAFETPLLDACIGDCAAITILKLLRARHPAVYGQLLIKVLLGLPCAIDIVSEGDATVRRIDVPIRDVLSQRKWSSLQAIVKLCAPTCSSPINRVLISAITETYVCSGMNQSPTFWRIAMNDMIYSYFNLSVHVASLITVAGEFPAIMDRKSDLLADEYDRNAQRLIADEPLEFAVAREMLVADFGFSQDAADGVLDACVRDIHALYQWTKTPGGRPYLAYITVQDRVGTASGMTVAVAKALSAGDKIDDVKMAVVYGGFHKKIKELTLAFMGELSDEVQDYAEQIEVMLKYTQEKNANPGAGVALDPNFADRIVTHLLNEREQDGRIFDLPVFEARWRLGGGGAEFLTFWRCVEKYVPVGMHIFGCNARLDDTKHVSTITIVRTEKKAVTVAYSEGTRESRGVGPTFLMETFPSGVKTFTVSSPKGVVEIPLKNVEAISGKKIFGKEAIVFMPFRNVAAVDLP
jgi:hypothetical protein